MSGEAGKKEINFVEYEYRKLIVKKTMQAVYADSYRCFGWITDGEVNPTGKPDSITIKFKRNRKIRNKAEITRLQRQFDALIQEILRLEESKKTKASAIAYAVGVIGTVFMAGSVFAINAGKTWGCIILAIPGIMGWIIPYLLFKRISNKKTEQVNPIISQKYEELYCACEKANELLD